MARKRPTPKGDAGGCKYRISATARPLGREIAPEVVWGFHQTMGSVVSSPTVHNGVVFIGVDDGTVYAMDGKTGNPKWVYSTVGGGWSSPAYADGIAYVGSRSGVMYGIDAIAGTLKCSANTGDPIGYRSPAAANGVIYVGSEGGNLYAFDASSCLISMNLSQLLKLPLGSGSPIQSSPTVAKGMVYVQTPDGVFALAPQ